MGLGEQSKPRAGSCLRNGEGWLADFDLVQGRKVAVEDFECFAFIFRPEGLEVILGSTLLLRHPSLYGHGVIGLVLGEWSVHGLQECLLKL